MAGFSDEDKTIKIRGYNEEFSWGMRTDQANDADDGEKIKLLDAKHPRLTDVTINEKYTR